MRTPIGFAIDRLRARHPRSVRKDARAARREAVRNATPSPPAEPAHRPVEAPPVGTLVDVDEHGRARVKDGPVPAEQVANAQPWYLERHGARR